MEWIELDTNASFFYLLSLGWELIFYKLWTIENQTEYSNADTLFDNLCTHEVSIFYITLESPKKKDE